MTSYVAFLRAINVGGHVVPMERLRALFEELKLREVATFIASGNVLFETASADEAKLEARIERRLADALGYEVTTFVRPVAALPAIVDAAPDEPGVQALTVAFLKGPPDAGAAERLAALRTPTDEFRLHGREMYWLCRTRISDSKVTGPRLERALGGPSTSRNITTVRRLAEKYAGG